MLVWFDAFTQNVDRTPRNANLLVWHRRLYPIDHGAALFFHHDWPAMNQKIGSPFPQIQHHILLPWAAEIEAAGIVARQRLTPDLLGAIVAEVPDSWLDAIPGNLNPADRRAGYLDFFVRRLAASHTFEQEAIRVRASHV